MTARRCLVLGGSGAVGGAVCEALAVAGARVAFTYLRHEAAAQALLARLPGTVSLRADLTDPAAVEAAADSAILAFGDIDALVHAAGAPLDAPPDASSSASESASSETLPAASGLADIDVAAWDHAHAVNVRSAFLAVRRLLPSFARRGRGDVVFVGSVDVVKSLPAPAHHASSKAAQRGLAAALAKELGPRNVRVNVVAPGLLEGGLSRAVPAALRREYLQHTGARRFGKPAEIAALVRYLVLENTYITGQTLVADGGL